MHLLKRIKPIKLVFYTASASAFEYFKPVYARDYKPSWLKEVKVDKNTPHVKHCYGLRQSFNTGFIIPLWTDIFFSTRIHEGGSLESRNIIANDQATFVDLFNSGDDDRSVHTAERDLFKIVSPWHCVCDEEIDFVAMENMFSRQITGIEFVSGTLQFKYQNATNMFFYLANLDKDVNLMAGDAPFIFKQLSERPLEIKSYYDPDKAQYYEYLKRHVPFRSFNMFKGMKASKTNKRIGR